MQFRSWNRLFSEYERSLLRLLKRGTIRPHETRTKGFQRSLGSIVLSMLGGVAKVNARSWREAAFKSTRAKEVYKGLQDEIKSQGFGAALRRLVRSNAKLISTIPQDVAKQVTAHAQKMQQEGKRALEIEKFIEAKRKDLTVTQIRRIARTEVSKAESDLTEIRASNLGINWYQWISSEDQRVRTSHRFMHNVLVAFNDPPNPEVLAGEKKAANNYHAGRIWNCRCLEAPLISLDEITWPARVYSKGRVTRMTRSQFAKLAGLEKVA